MSRLPKIREIQKAVARHYGIPLGKMREPSPQHRTDANCFEFSRPRQVAICLSTRLTEHTFSRIGDFFGGRDHSTVIHAMRAVEQRRARDGKLHEDLRLLTLELLRGGAL